MNGGAASTFPRRDSRNNMKSGGRFSNYHRRPFFQEESLGLYFNSSIDAAYETGRGYPDISLGDYYGDHLRINYTSVTSATILAGLISNINAVRISIGKGSIGWMNHVLYMKNSSFLKDVILDNNRCNGQDACCNEGHDVGPGWDPASGLGSLNYGQFHEVFISLGSSSVNGTLITPVISPISDHRLLPTTYLGGRNKILSNITNSQLKIIGLFRRPPGQPSSQPTGQPSSKPTGQPSSMPIGHPTSEPTGQPLSRPTGQPSSKRTGQPSSQPIGHPTEIGRAHV